MTSRTGPDRCPGLVRPFVSGDGSIVRVRVPGGQIRAAALAELSTLAGRHGDPDLQVTSRSGVQLRGLPDPVPAALADELVATGLFPSLTHDRARNVLADPLDRGLDPLVAALDAAICAEPRLAELPGRFLLGVSGPEGGVLGERLDVAYQRLTSTSGRLILAGRQRPCSPEEAVAELVAVALAFVRERRDEATWHLGELDASAAILAGTTPATITTPAPPPFGPVGPDLVVGLPLGLLTPAQVAALADVADELVLTPWRSVVVRGGAGHEGRLRDVGLATDPGSPWRRLSACIGARGCHRTDVDTHAVALNLAAEATGAAEATDRRAIDREDDVSAVHVIGCERACGRPAGPHRLLLPPSPATTAAPPRSPR